ncbi:unnamed protein product, partial [Ectocarpus sp. 12 AP-2014]
MRCVRHRLRKGCGGRVSLVRGRLPGRHVFPASRGAAGYGRGDRASGDIPGGRQEGRVFHRGEHQGVRP